MPPKKNKGKGKGKGKKGKKEKKAEPEPVLEVIDENSKQFFLVQIKDLEDKLKRYQKKSDELELLCKKYEVQYETSNTDKKDILSHYKKELDMKKEEIHDLNDRLIGLQQTKDAEKDAFDKQLTDLRTEFQETKDVLTNQNNSLLAKLTALEEFKSQKEELLAKLESLEKQIDELNFEHQNKLNNIEKKVIIDNDRLKKDMIVKVSQVAAEFRRVSNKQMADTTKRTIKENVSINNQLQRMSDKVIKMIEENDSVKIKEKVQKRHIDLLEENEKEFARKNVSNLKIIRMLTEKCRNQEAIINDLEEKYNELKENESNQEQIIQNLEAQIEHLQNVDKECERLREELTHLREELATSVKYRAKMENVLKQASDSIAIVLSKKAASKKGEEDDEWNDLDKRDNMLENMLILLNSAASLGFGPSPQAFSSNYEQKPRLAEYPGSGKGIRKNQVPMNNVASSEGNFNPHYKLGDLGLVPRQADILFTNYEKNKLFGSQKQLGSIQKLTRKSVATQTLDLSRASIFGVEGADALKAEQPTHPIFENRERKKPAKSQILMPLNGQQRVTDKVF